MRIGFIGLGRMGAPMARNLLRAGHSLAVHDVRRDAAEPHLAAGARWADSPADAAHDAELVFTCLPTPADVEAAVLGEQGIAAGAATGSVVADLSSNAPRVVRRLYAALDERGIAFLDAPVSGGVGGAERGTLQVMVGGDASAFERVRPALAAIGDKLTRTGDVGSATVTKLVHNMVYIGTRQLLAEGLTLGVKAGVAPRVLLDAMKGSAFGQGLLLDHFLPETIFKGRFEPVRFALRLAKKDVGLLTELAREHGVPTAMADLTERALDEAMARGWGDRDYAVPFLLQEERAGVEVRET